MSFRGVLVLIAFIVAMRFSAEMIGEWFRYVVLSLMLGAIPVLTWLNRKILRELASELTRWDDFGREQFLLLTEEWEDRVELTEEMGEELPVVPIRGERERYAFHSGWPILTQGIAGMCFAIVLFVGVYTFIDPTQLGTPTDITGALLVFTVGGALFLWYGRTFERYFEVDRDGIREVTKHGQKAISWTDIEDARHSSLRGGVVVSSSADRMVLSTSLVDYGRLINIVLSRVRRSGR